jgi:hypothetical protein
LIRDDLIGPAGGPEEELVDAPIDRYLLGLLAPTRSRDVVAVCDNEEEGGAADEVSEDELAVAVDAGEDGSTEERPAAVNQLVPSSFGLTFALEPGCTRVVVAASWGAYSRATSEEEGRPRRAAAARLAPSRLRR